MHTRSGSPPRIFSRVEREWPIRSRVILTTPLVNDLKEAQPCTNSFRARNLSSYESILLARRTQSYNKDRDRISLPRAPSDEIPGPLQSAASSPDMTVWSGTPCPEVMPHHMHNFYYNQTVTCLQMVTEGISNNMVLLGLTVMTRRALETDV